MGLRINTNVTALTALRTLNVNDRNQATALERLSTGLRINRAGDDPSGLVISELLRTQLSGLNQAVDNSRNASNMINVADAQLQKVSDLLTGIQESIVFAQNTGGSSSAQILAEQDAVDQAINAIDRIASTTRFADRQLLNGVSSYQITGITPGGGATGIDVVNDLHLRSVEFTGTAASVTQRTLAIDPTVNPQRGAIIIDTTSFTVSTGGATLRITGPRGTADVVLQAGANTNDQFTSAINTVTGVTGVYASSFSSTVAMRTEEFGFDQFLKLEGVSGVVSLVGATATFNTLADGSTTVAGTLLDSGISSGLSAGESVFDRGQNGQVLFEGVSYTGIGREFSILSKATSFRFKLDPDTFSPDATTLGISTGLTTASTITVARSGLNFQLNELPLPTDTLAVGIESVAPSVLGAQVFRDKIAGASTAAADDPQKGGFLSSIKTGTGNDLFQNAANASFIVGAAVTQVSNLRSFLGSIQANTIEPNIDALGVHIENLSASLSTLRDLNFAEETAKFTKTQILFQANVAVLASANLIPQSILTLLR